jgi:hypothetical protein
MYGQRKVYLAIEFLFVEGQGRTDSIRPLTHKNGTGKSPFTLLQIPVGKNLKQAAKQVKSKAKPTEGVGQIGSIRGKDDREGGLKMPSLDVAGGSESPDSDVYDNEAVNPVVLIQQFKSAGFAFESAGLGDD